MSSQQLPLFFYIYPISSSSFLPFSLSLSPLSKQPTHFLSLSLSFIPFIIFFPNVLFWRRSRSVLSPGSGLWVYAGRNPGALVPLRRSGRQVELRFTRLVPRIHVFNRREKKEANDIEPGVGETVEVKEEEAFGEPGGSNGPDEGEEPGA